MKNEVYYAPVKKILTIINSCQNDSQLQNSEKVVNDYVKLVTKQGISNSLDLKKRLYQEIEQREEALYLVNILKDLNPETEPIKVLKRKPIKRITRFVAAIIIFIILMFGSFNLFRCDNTNQQSNQEIINKFYAPYEMTLITRSLNNDILMQEAVVLYKNKNYKEAANIFKQILKENNSNIAAIQLYSGISYLEIKEYQKANSLFNQIINHNDNLYIEQAEWCLGFCFIMENDKEKAIEQFKKIMSEKGYYSKNAKQILKKLN
ncbi:MAG: tetratricopeptide repeat protein [Clostridia bacterium]